LVKDTSEVKIINVLLKLKSNGLSESTLRTIGYILKELSHHCILDNPQSVKEYIANKKCTNSFKIQMVKAYNYYAAFNGIQWIKPKYRYERKLPKIPSKENIMKVVSASRKYAVIFKVLMETGVMPYELSKVSKNDIDFDRGLFTVQGFKGHNSRVFKLSDETIAMLKLYFSKYQSFPEATWIKKMWIKTRNKVACKLSEPQLRSIRLYDLRHYYATMLYAKTKDILYVMKQLGHKKLETTLIYTQLTNFPNDEYYSATATTIDEAKQLIEQGFEYVTDFNGVKLFRKRK
jgi:integrase